MYLYAIALFVHISAAIAMFTGLGAWLFGALALRRADRVSASGGSVGGASGTHDSLLLAWPAPSGARGNRRVANRRHWRRLGNRQPEQVGDQ